MSALEIFLLVVIYLVSAGSLSLLYVANSDDIDPKAAKVILMLMFVPAVNTLAILFISFLSWAEIIFKRKKSDG